MCLFENDCLLFDEGSCPLVSKDEENCPGRYVSFCKFCYSCEYRDHCKKECELENEAIQNQI